MKRGLIATEWIEKHGGAEKVVDRLAAGAPGATVACLWDEDPGRYLGHAVVESVLARSVRFSSKALRLPLMPMVWDRFDLEPFEWVLASSHVFGHHIAARAAAMGLPSYAYVHTPARFLWAPELDPRGNHVLARLGGATFRRLDRRRASGEVQYAANSEFIKERIKKAWGFESTVIHPPVEVARILSVPSWADQLTADDAETLAALPNEFVLGASRMVRYKALDTVVRFGNDVGLPVVLAGDGPDRPRLQELATRSSTPVQFLGRVSDQLLFALYQRATAFVFPAIEDFGIMPVEALAAGGRVVVNTVGGAAESVTHGEAGAQCSFGSSQESREALDAVVSVTAEARRARATQFSGEVFDDAVARWTDGRIMQSSPSTARR